MSFASDLLIGFVYTLPPAMQNPCQCSAKTQNHSRRTCRTTDVHGNKFCACCRKSCDLSVAIARCSSPSQDNLAVEFFFQDSDRNQGCRAAEDNTTIAIIIVIFSLSQLLKPMYNYKDVLIR